MLFYTCIFIIFSISSLFIKRELYTYFTLLLCLFLFIFAGARKLGSSLDDLNYFYSLYYKSANFEYLYTLIEKFNAFLFGGNIMAQFLIVSFFSLLFLFVSSIYYKKIAPWSILIYMSHVFLYRDMIQIRAAVAYNIVLLSFVLISHRGAILRPAFLFLTAAGFHISSLFAYVAFLLKIEFLTLRRYVIFLSITLPLAILFDISVLFAFIMPYLPSAFNAPLNAYILDEGGFTYSMGVLNPTTIKTIIFCLVFLYNKERLAVFFGNVFFINIYALSSLILIVFNDFAVFSSRMASMFSSVEIFLVPALIFTLPKNGKRMYALFFTIVYSVIFSLNIFHKCMLCEYKFDLF
ncbi:EpsG family protein [Aeromonas sp. s6]|uniref:EpsG family protein n=1 Tax=Aeromonas sp. s6 TaxID=3138488 RepID=UPI0034A46E31